MPRVGVLVLGVLLAGCTSTDGPGADGGQDGETPTIGATESPTGDDPTPPDASAPADGDGADDGVPGADPDDEQVAGDDTDDEQVTVEVHFGAPDGEPEQTAPVRREVPAPAVLEGALEALLEGPTEEERAAGRESWFSTETAGLLRSVRLEDRTATVDFDGRMREIIPNASTSSGSAALLASLDATATQFPSVDEAIYALDGDVDAFYLWLQLVPPGR